MRKKEKLMASVSSKTSSHKHNKSEPSKEDLLDNLDREVLYSNNIKVCFKVYINGQEIIYCVSGRVGQAIAWLVLFGANGITALEVSSWALRLAAYIGVLRHKHRVEISKKMMEGSTQDIFLKVPLSLFQSKA